MDEEGNPLAEPVVVDAAVRDLGPDTPVRPLGISGVALNPSVGLSSTGLLVRTRGLVVEKGSDYIRIDDGSYFRDQELTAEAPWFGAYVQCDPADYALGDCVCVTGISSCFKTDSGQVARQILVRRAEDIRKLSP